MKEIVKVGGVEFYEDEIKEIYKSKKYIVTYSKIYQVHYSQNAGYYGSLVYSKTIQPGHVGLAQRGRFYIMDAARINKMLGFNLLKEL